MTVLLSDEQLSTLLREKSDLSHDDMKHIISKKLQIGLLVIPDLITEFVRANPEWYVESFFDAFCTAAGMDNFLLLKRAFPQIHIQMMGPMIIIGSNFFSKLNMTHELKVKKHHLPIPSCGTCCQIIGNYQKLYDHSPGTFACESCPNDKPLGCSTCHLQTSLYVFSCMHPICQGCMMFEKTCTVCGISKSQSFVPVTTQEAAVLFLKDLGA